MLEILPFQISRSTTEPKQLKQYSTGTQTCKPIEKKNRKLKHKYINYSYLIFDKVTKYTNQVKVSSRNGAEKTTCLQCHRMKLYSYLLSYIKLTPCRLKKKYIAVVVIL